MDLNELESKYILPALGWFQFVIHESIKRNLGGIPLYPDFSRSNHEPLEYTAMTDILLSFSRGLESGILPYREEIKQDILTLCRFCIDDANRCLGVDELGGVIIHTENNNRVCSVDATAEAVIALSTISGFLEREGKVFKGEINDAILNGISFLLRQQLPDGWWCVNNTLAHINKKETSRTNPTYLAITALATALDKKKISCNCEVEKVISKFNTLCHEIKIDREKPPSGETLKLITSAAAMDKAIPGSIPKINELRKTLVDTLERNWVFGSDDIVYKFYIDAEQDAKPDSLEYKL